MDRSYLQWRGQSWRVQVAVPARLRGAVGCAVLYHPLHTDSLAAANREKHKHVHLLKKRIEEAARQPADDPLTEEALQWREAAGEEYASTLLERRYEELVRSRGKPTADALVEIATGRATPITSTLIEEWIAERQMKPRQVLDYRRAVRKLLAHLPTATVEGVDKRVAGDYRAALTRLGVHPRTAAKDISALASLWKHLESRGVAPSNPWRGLGGYSKTPATGRGSARKRPLTGTEVARLLTSNHASPMLRDAVTILALSGMRTEELSRLKVSDLRDLTGPMPYVALRGTKTAAAHRDVPINSQALPIILQRAKGKAPGDYLLHELPTPPEGSAMERGQPITKAFGRLRKRLGIDEREPGARQANVDLHGLRRFAIASMRDALNAGATGYSMRTVAQIVGHDVGDLGLSMTSMYAGEEPLSAKAKAIGAIRLPSP
jgi:integrase